MNARDLAALAALGAVGYHLSKGKGKKGEEDTIDASPKKTSSDDYDAESNLERRYPKPSDGMRPQDVTQGGKGTGSLTRSVAPKPEVEKAPVEDYGNEGRRTSSTGDKVAAPAPKATFSSSEAGMKSYVPRRTGQTPSAVQQTSRPQSMARYPGGLAKRGANVSVPEDKPITRLLGTDQDYLDAMMATAPVGLAAKLAAKMAYKKDAPLKYYDQPALGGPSTPLLGAPAKQLTGPSKTDLMARDRANRASERENAMTRENADRYGLNPNAPGYDAAASSLRDRLGGRDFTLKKKGGVIKKMASGGMTSRSSSASSRGDGIAQRGKTRGSMR